MGGVRNSSWAMAGWLAMAALAVAIAAGALRYALPQAPGAAPLHNFFAHRIALSIHATTGAIACLIGPWQFLNGFRARHWTLHRRIGWVYAAAVGTSWVASLPMAAHAETGVWASAGFLLLALLWIVCTTTAIAMIAGKRDFPAHRAWMIRSYALTAAAITLRIYLPLSVVLHLPFEMAYPAIAWLCWIPNFIAAEVYLRMGALRIKGLRAETAP
jgi:uncharacterized membrane protein